MIIPYILLQKFIYPNLKIDYESYLTHSTIIFSTTIMLNILCWFKDPGYVKQDPTLDFIDLLE